MSTQLPRISIVIPCYNQAQFAHEAVLSTKTAYGGPLQIIIVNDGSTAGQAARQLDDVARLLGDSRCQIEILTQENRGLSGARNAGIARATGEFLQLLDCDDLLLPGKLDAQIRHFRIAAALDVSVVDCIYSNDAVDRFERHSKFLSDWNFESRDFAMNWERGFSLPIHCALFRRSTFDHQRFDERQRSKEDWLFWSELVGRGARIAYIGGPGVIYRIHDASLCRVSPDIGRQWLTAALEIDKFVHDDIPEFLDSAVGWYKKNYAVFDDEDEDSEDESDAAKARKCPDDEDDEDDDSSDAKVEIDELPLVKVDPPKPAASHRAGAHAVGRSAGTPRCSIVVPVFEHFEYLQTCLDSAVAQCDERVELVIVDDGSRDLRVRPLLLSYEQDYGATLVLQQKNAGISMTLNAGVDKARGEFVAFLDCDDALASGAIERALGYLDRHADCDYLFTDRLDISEQDEIVRLARYGGYRDDRFRGAFNEDILNGMFASHLKVIRKSAIERAGGFDPSVQGVQDWAMALAIAEFGVFGYLPEPLYYHRVHSGSVTSGDRRGQFHRTNVVRRKFVQRYIERGAVPGAESRGAATPKVLTPVELQPWSLARLAAQGPLHLDTTGGVTHPELWAIREFNSYFENILWSAPEVHAALIGYVWSPDVLTHKTRA